MGNNMIKISTKVPFKVSARTARLIGRENIATSKGAIIELVKNGYDSDSKVSIVYFDNKYSTFLNEISEEHYHELIRKGISTDTLEKIYIKREDSYQLIENIDEELKASYKKQISKLSILYIIDAGEGMTQNVIRQHWMTIGTDNKSNNIFTKNGRVKAGAKGIGRFALDKLGSKCEMITIYNPDNHPIDTDENSFPSGYCGYNWKVNWEDFEGEFKTIDTVNAELTGIEKSSLLEEIQKLIPEFDLSKITSEKDFKYGTLLKISELRDNWDDYYVEQVYSDLEVLVPPKETGGFEIHLNSSLYPDKYGEVYGSICDDFDYKLIAIADENQNVKIKIVRNEYDVELIPSDFFEREAMKQHPFQKSDFVNGEWEVTRTFSQLMKGFKAVDEDDVFSNIGIFEFSFYFLKRAYNTTDADRFFNRKFMANERKDWLNKFGGIKLFRDNFRVRPYGEVKDVAFDWLGLGNRKSASPAGIAKKEGGYRVEPENVAGAVKISRLTNVDFEDKSSREGLQDNKTFQVFKQLLAAIISLFEEDRAFIAREMADYDEIKFGPERDRKKAEELAKRILANSRAKKENKSKEAEGKSENSKSTEDQSDDKDKELLASEIERKEEEIEKLKEEQKVLRGLASSGIVLASFSHDLSKLNDVLSSRTDKLKNLLLEKIVEQDYDGVESRKNPFIQLERIKKQDLKLQNWLNFSLGATRKDKRKRKQLFLKKYFFDLKADWHTVFENRGIALKIDDVEDLDLRVFEIDFDSIFNNLLVNSIDAFNILKESRDRQIEIKASSSSKEIVIDYYDNGPGLSSDITEPEKIFEPLFTTRRNPYTGEEEGTGLGMWLVKSIVIENDGIVKLLFPQIGFGVRLIFPIKYKR
jgi:signal transduction histidine kinase